MAEQLAGNTPDPTVGNAISEPVIPALPAGKSSNKLPWILLGGLLGLIGICAVICIAAGGIALVGSIRERVPVQSTLDEFMQHMLAKDVDAAYAHFSPRAQRQTTKADLAKLLQGKNYAVIDGYRSLTVDTLNLNTGFYTNPDVPQGLVATVTGTITYSDGFTGKISAVLEKVDTVWKMYSFNVVVPPDKFGP